MPGGCARASCPWRGGYGGVTTRILAVVFIVAFVVAVVFILAEPSSGVVPSAGVVQPADTGDTGEEGGERHCLNRALGYPCPEVPARDGGDLRP